MTLALLDEPAVRQRAHLLSVKQYYRMAETGIIAEKVELLEGVIVDKTPQSPLHAYLVFILTDWLRRVISGNLHLRTEKPLTCLSSAPEPDLAVIRGQPRDYIRDHPVTAELVIEIAISSMEIDRRKATIYAAAGVLEYWIVLPEQRQIELHKVLSDGQYAVRRLFSGSETARSEVLPDFEVNVEELFRE